MGPQPNMRTTRTFLPLLAAALDPATRHELAHAEAQQRHLEAQTRALRDLPLSRRHAAKLAQIADWVVDHMLERQRVEVERRENEAKPGSGLAKSLAWVDEQRPAVRAEVVTPERQRVWSWMLEKGWPALEIARLEASDEQVTALDAVGGVE